ncbi:MAG: UDP-N-acetylmuramate--L-alanine ligase [Armatimonadota bacterium]|nr:UDP-N-acetylmuramate--L-alanine ligase [Armatimonadota bacterium]MDW8156922.1 UDP-N-acetylmuramate--L-alanine ligase [Armatimonadota bacterium]
MGAGGSGMSPLAEVYARRGAHVSGCDLRDSPALRRLETVGVQVYVGHTPDHLEDAQRVVVSRAVPPTEPELAAARARGLPVLHRAELLAELVAGGDSVGVAGTHGKTTTTALVSVALEAAGLDPTAVVGGEVRPYGGGARVGSGPTVAEVDESDGSLVRVRVHSAVVTGLDLTDHADHYRDLTSLLNTFAQFVAATDPGGWVVLCADCPNAGRLAPHARGRVVTYGLQSGSYRGRVLEVQGRWSRFVLQQRGREVGEVLLSLPGRHNVLNATAALAVGLERGASFEAMREALARFGGVRRRFEVYCDAPLVVDDYAHNPVKVRAFLRAVREAWPGRRVVAVFQPHRYSRTRTTYRQYAEAFEDADEVVVTELYPADEPPEPGVSGRLIADHLRHPRVRWVPELEDVVGVLLGCVRPEDVVATLGAGDVWRVAQRLAQEVKR